MKSRTEREEDGWLSEQGGHFSRDCKISRTKFSRDFFFLAEKKFQLARPEANKLFHVSLNWNVLVYWKDLFFFSQINMKTCQYVMGVAWLEVDNKKFSLCRECFRWEVGGTEKISFNGLPFGLRARSVSSY